MSVSSMVKMGLVVGAMAVLTGCQDPVSAMLTKVSENDSYVPVLTDYHKKSQFANFTNWERMPVSNKVNLKITSSTGETEKLDLARLRERTISALSDKLIQISEDGTPVTIDITRYGVSGYGNNGGQSSSVGMGGFASSLGATLVQSVAAEAIVRSKPSDGFEKTASFTIKSNSFETMGNVGAGYNSTSPDRLAENYIAAAIAEFAIINRELK